MSGPSLPAKGSHYDHGKWDIASLIFIEANARRICAAVNACKGISTKALERDAVHILLEAVQVAWRRSAHHEKLTLQECNQLCAAIVAATEGAA